MAYYPAGALSDRIDRRVVMLVLACLAVVCSAVLLLRTGHSAWVILVTVGLFGSFEFPLYGLCVATTNDRVREQSFSEVASELLVLYGVGTVLGPFAAAPLMHAGPANLFLFTGLVLLLFVGITATRMAARPETEAEHKRPHNALTTARNAIWMLGPDAGEALEKRRTADDV